jgi:hypothetical protein
VQNVLKVLIQNVQHGVAESPDKKQGGHHDEREEQGVGLFRGLHHSCIDLYRQTLPARKPAVGA